MRKIISKDNKLISPLNLKNDSTDEEIKNSFYALKNFTGDYIKDLGEICADILNNGQIKLIRLISKDKNLINNIVDESIKKFFVDDYLYLIWSKIGFVINKNMAKKIIDYSPKLYLKCYHINDSKVYCDRDIAKEVVNKLNKRYKNIIDYSKYPGLFDLIINYGISSEDIKNKRNIEKFIKDNI